MNSIKFLKNGNETFNEIIDCIKNAKNSIYINMFIWRDDKIGNTIIKELINAASRNVKIKIIKDRYGLICEYSEESRKSLFHKKTNLIEKTVINYLRNRYNNNYMETSESYDENKSLYDSFFNNKNIEIFSDKNRYDHSKFYIFDNEILIMGGVNIEDKENDKDLNGRKYTDYMIEFSSENVVNEFLLYYNKPLVKNEKTFYINKKEDNYYSIKRLYLDMIKKATRRIVIIMPYFSYQKDFIKEMLNASSKNVDITIIIPKSANFFDDSNKKNVKYILNKSKNIKILLNDNMIHAKVLVSDDSISIGSANINKKSLYSLSELNAYINLKENKYGFTNYNEFVDKINENINKIINSSIRVNEKDLDYNRLTCFVEELFF